jgi:hypothetical protein
MTPTWLIAERIVKLIKATSKPARRISTAKIGNLFGPTESPASDIPCGNCYRVDAGAICISQIVSLIELHPV